MDILVLFIFLCDDSLLAVLLEFLGEEKTPKAHRPVKCLLPPCLRD
jgi:hypothetical protein